MVFQRVLRGDYCSDTPPSKIALFGSCDEVYCWQVDPSCVGINSSFCRPCDDANDARDYCSDPSGNILWSDGDPMNITPRNFMSYGHCLSLFTLQQAARMHCHLMTIFQDYVNYTSTNPCDAPIADFTYTKGIICSGNPTTVVFTDNSFNATSWLWDFGDGNSSTSQNPVHVYDAPGTYTVTLTASNSSGSNMEQRIIVLESVHILPFLETFDDTKFPPDDWENLNVQGDCIKWMRRTDDPLFCEFAPCEWGKYSNPDITCTEKTICTTSEDTCCCPLVPIVGANTVTGNPAARIRPHCCDENTIGNIDALITPSLDFTDAFNPILTFNVAYREFCSQSDCPQYVDELNVYYSTDCGNSWVNIYDKSGSTLATVTPPLDCTFIPQNASDWRLETIDLNFLRCEPNVKIKFEFTHGWNNSLYLDDINVFDNTVFTDITIDVNTVWNTDQIITGTVFITSTGNLTIQSPARIQFVPQGKIIVEPSGRLTLTDGATLTGLDAPCTSMWEGIDVYGNPSLDHSSANQAFHGKLTIINGATIEHARSIRSGAPVNPFPLPSINAGGGIIVAENSNFIDNGVSIEYMPYNFDDNFASNIYNNRFISTGALRDPAYTTTDNPTGRPSYFIKLWDAGPCCITLNTFENNVYDGYSKTTGIWSTDARFSPNSNTFRNINSGVTSYFTLGFIPNSEIIIANNTFQNVHTSVRIEGGRYDLIINNSFNPAGDADDRNFYGIFLKSTYGFQIGFRRCRLPAGNFILGSNAFNKIKYGIFCINSFDGGGEIDYGNYFVNCWRGTDIRGNNQALDIKCNPYTNYESAAWVLTDWKEIFPWGSGRWTALLKNQGTCDQNALKNAAGNDFNDIDTLLPRFDYDIYSFSEVDGGGRFTYSHHKPGALFPNVKPQRITGLVTLNQCFPKKSNISCSSGPCIALRPREQIIGDIDRETRAPERQLLVNELIHTDLANNERHKTIEFLEGDTCLTGKCLLAGTFIRDRQFAKAENILNQIPQDNPENQNFVKYNRALLDLEQNSKTLFEMNTAQEQIIREVAFSPTVVATHAQAVLRLVFGENNFGTIVSVPDSSGNRAGNFPEDNSSEEQKIGNTESKAAVSIIPNPVSNTAVIKFSIPDGVLNAEIKIYDMLGREIKKYKLTGEQGELPITTEDMINGVYVYTLVLDGQRALNKRMVIIK